jgi:hypothetical protein
MVFLRVVLLSEESVEKGLRSGMSEDYSSDVRVAERSASLMSSAPKPIWMSAGG